jgi:hypothetical protein
MKIKSTDERNVSHRVAAYCDEPTPREVNKQQEREKREVDRTNSFTSIPPQQTTVIVVGSRGMHPLKKMKEFVLVA